MSDETASRFGLSPVARGRTYLPGRVRAASTLGCCALVFGGLVWMMWPRPAREPEPSAATSATWGMGRVLPERPSLVISPPPEPVAVPPVRPPQVAPPVAPVVAPAELRAMGFWEDANAANQARDRPHPGPSASLSDRACQQRF